MVNVVHLPRIVLNVFHLIRIVLNVFHLIKIVLIVVPRRKIVNVFRGDFGSGRLQLVTSILPQNDAYPINGL